MIDLQKDGGLWSVTIRRPDKANSLTKVMLEQLADIAEAAADAVMGAKVLVITGEGRVFSAGADLDEARAGLAIDPIWERLSGAIAAAPCLTIAALNGTLAGGAFGMALACDLRIAVPTAKFFYPVMKLGFLPQPSDSKRMRALIGPSRTKLILMAGQKISAADALAFGLIDRVLEHDSFADEIAALSGDALAATPENLSAIKVMCG
ncbi:enoyl-CoA hydratase [Marinosulfonomonas sp. PRT-SC04]|nr:enoyl-CoA hydratase [Marinosulfonomonas sp. PRT-SC04]